MASKLNPPVLHLCRTLRPSSHALSRASSRWVTRLHEPERAITAEFCRLLIRRPRSFSSISRLGDADGMNAVPDSKYNLEV